MSKEVVLKKDALWKSFFMIGGVIAMIYQYSILSLTEYFALKVRKNIFIYLMATFSTGQLLSFLLLYFIGKRLSVRPTLLISLLLGSISYGLMFMSIYVFPSANGKLIGCLVFMFINAITMTVFLIKITSLSTGIGNIELVLLNLGTGLSGVSSNIILFIFSLIFPFKNNEIDYVRQLEYQLIGYSCVIALILISFYIVETLFNKKYFDNVYSEYRYSNIDKDIAHPIDANSTFKHGIDCYAGQFLNYAISISILSYFLAGAFFQFDFEKSKIYTVAVFNFFFNISDFLAKLIPHKFLVKGFVKMHSLSLVRILTVLYFVLIIKLDKEGGFFSKGWIRFIILSISGFFHGYLKNAFMTNCADRFNDIGNKELSGFYSIFSVITGYFVGGIIGLTTEIEI